MRQRARSVEGRLRDAALGVLDRLRLIEDAMSQSTSSEDVDAIEPQQRVAGQRDVGFGIELAIRVPW